MQLRRNDVVQFTEGHKWCGCFGFINEVKGTRIMVGVPVPEQGTAYIFCTEDDIEFVGVAILELVIPDDNDED